jgi:hypothetical protein
MTDVQNEFGAWVAAYEEAWRAPSAVPSQVCPSSGGTTLHLIFVVDDLDAVAGTAVFWCDACLRGLMPARAPIPIGATKVLRGLEEVPNYKLVIDNS